MSVTQKNVSTLCEELKKLGFLVVPKAFDPLCEATVGDNFPNPISKLDKENIREHEEDKKLFLLLAALRDPTDGWEEGSAETRRSGTSLL
nr:MAG TPA: hypothetical protein [Caudoviricetes sp.]